jgi:hypothetical protein
VKGDLTSAAAYINGTAGAYGEEEEGEYADELAND